MTTAQLLDQAVRAAREPGERQFVAWPFEAPIEDPLPAAFVAVDDRFYLERPSEGLRVLALGCLETIEPRGAGRFGDADAARAALLARVHHAPADLPRLVGGFAFDAEHRAEGVWKGFPASRLWLPELAWFERDDQRSAVIHVAVEAGDDAATLRARADASAARWRALLAEGPEHPADRRPPAHYEIDAAYPGDDYCDRAGRALDAIARGDLEKLVLARAVTVRAEQRFDAARTLETLRAAHGGCALFAVGRGDASFIGATPERLLRVEAGRAETSAVAGSAPRGREPLEDAALARALRESKKEQSEHAIVVRALRAAFDQCCDDTDAPQAPRLLQLEGVQHLETPVRGTLRDGTTLLMLAGALHPTPAVGGAPDAEARAWLAANEPCRRGWYAGVVGFADAKGGGELCVALRSALLRGERAELWAGAGLVTGSEPVAELRETRLKLRTLLHALVEP